MVDLAKRQTVIRTAGWIAILSWPAGYLMGLLMSIGQDAAGAGMAYGMGIVVVVMLVNIPASIYLLRYSWGAWGSLDRGHKALVVIPLLPFAVLFIAVVGTCLAELIYALTR